MNEIDPKKNGHTKQDIARNPIVRVRILHSKTSNPGEEDQNDRWEYQYHSSH